MLQALFGRRQAANSPIRQITATELNDELQNGNAPILVDVRTPNEYQNDGHIAGSRLLPLNVFMQRIKELPQDKPIVCVCRSGNRSQAAAEQLLTQGFEDVANLSGGMFGWRRAGLPIE
jgi:rhodanese-related sulfurtransferase